jgi:drug/metabolite transporter (DMT)-like permease
MKDQTKARIGVLIGNFFFGTSVIAVKHITPSLLSPFALTTIRIVTTTVLFWLMYAVKPTRIRIAKKDFLLFIFCALTGIAMNQTFSMWGMALTSPIHASLLVLTTPITITLLAAWFLKEPLGSLKLLGLFLGISGGALLVFSRDLSSHAGGQQSLGDLFIIMGALSYSTYAILIKPLMTRYKAAHILQWVFLFACFASVPLGWKDLAEVRWPLFDGWSWCAMVYVVLGATFFAYQLMNYGISKLGASITGSYIYLQPFFATLASMLILNESLNLPKIGAALLIMTGVFLTNYKK